jgi:hypothetical protein
MNGEIRRVLDFPLGPGIDGDQNSLTSYRQMTRCRLNSDGIGASGIRLKLAFHVHRLCVHELFDPVAAELSSITGLLDPAKRQARIGCN